ncbi:MAG: hypothetical protein H6Q90_5299 [Deltaproteobacteria bacterium]|nr:hypothetical protein [Deltaproteobacteria bacterium]
MARTKRCPRTGAMSVCPTGFRDLAPSVVELRHPV